MRIRIPKYAGEACLVGASLFLCLAVIEVTLQAHRTWKRKQLAASKQKIEGEPLHVLVDSPVIYGLNPKHPEVSEQGLRNDEVAVPKPGNLWRLLILGDSVTFGTKVAKEDAYPARLEEFLASRTGKEVEVINAGVSGYSPYNQLEFYRTRGREFEPDIVVVGFCMNDVANPRLHWDYTGNFIDHIPHAAIPNTEYDRRVKRRRDSLLSRSALLATLERRTARLLRGDKEGKIPTFITGEDTLSIEVLLDENSPEWRWLTSMYQQLHAEITADGAELVVVLFPVSYQLDPDYPYMPQQKLTEYCRSRSIASLDLLPKFRENPLGGYFLEKVDGSRDAWHLSERGHHLTAMLLADLLLENR